MLTKTSFWLLTSTVHDTQHDPIHIKLSSSVSQSSIDSMESICLSFVRISRSLDFNQNPKIIAIDFQKSNNIHRSVSRTSRVSNPMGTVHIISLAPGLTQGFNRYGIFTQSSTVSELVSELLITNENKK